MSGIKRTAFAALAMVTSLSLAACGGGGGGDNGNGNGNGGNQTSGATVSKGVVTGLGSVVVNGIRFNTDTASVKIDDNPSTQDQLKIGMVVKVRGSSDDATNLGTATQVEANDALEGTISAVGANTITVMGQTVRIEDNVTRLSDDNGVKTFAGAAFAVDQVVEVHGFADDNGGLRATRVTKKATGEFEIKGFVVSTGAAGTFGLSLVPGGASVLTVTGTLPAGAVPGSFVEVKSNLAPVGGAITAVANGVKLEDNALGAVNEKVEVEGIVTTGNVESFTVNGQRVITSSATLFEGGLKTDFAVGVKVEAEGPLNAAGAIVATKISFRSNIKIEGKASNVTATSLQVLGKTVLINPAPMTRLDLVDSAPIANGDQVEVRAFVGSDPTSLVASRIRVRNPDTRAFLQGPVTAVNSAAGTLTILGTTVSTSGAQFRTSFDSTESAVSPAAFFAQIKPNVTVVKVKWDPFNAITDPVKEAEIEIGKTLSASGDDSISKGVVTAKGSVFVNGVRFHTGGAAILVDGVPAVEDNLKVGMVVKVRGTMDDSTRTGTATLVEANNALEGTIQAVNPANGTITVMGQTVRIEDNVTRLNDDSAQLFAGANFAVGEKVEVHGFMDDNGGLRATRVARNAEAEHEVKGFVVSIGSGSFGLSLTPGGAATLTVTGSLPAGAVVGSIVEVKANAAPLGGSVTATRVELEDRLGVANEKVEVEGIVMKGGTVDSFTVNGQKVITTPTTIFEGGLRADFVEGMKVEAEGPLNAAGVIVAVKVSFRSNIRIEADASAVTASGLTLLGKTVVINGFTRLDDGLPANGQRVEVRAFLANDGTTLIASRIRARSADAGTFLQGPVAAQNALNGTLTILGVPVSTNASTEFRVSFDSTDTPVTPAQFFAKVTTGVTVVKVRWASGDTGLPVQQAEIQLGN
ncbi:MAG: hypothetical protein A2075_10805 [Geobacteraceae bacterium GWC2_58_44]|nr:MAG: hypothetical protein A2075_10805 [Geobacteraceae bacterium GWC2_58_44]HBG06603.1 hypothetical protein [Geobacter sp.]